MKHLEKRQIILLAILAILVVVFVMWKFVLTSDSGSTTVEPVTTQTTVATSEVTTDPASPVPVTDPSATGVTDATVAPSPVPEVPFNAFAYRDPFTKQG